MCDLCRKTACPPACPNYGRNAVGEVQNEEFCLECGAELSFGEMFYRFPLGIVCSECAERLDVEGILRLSALRGTYALLDAVGATREWKG
ncbi:MAG: hypothetical protein J6B77_07740 [Clostridia bacterium]|nr:hypothetical protein [Clostridia bacterium]